MPVGDIGRSWNFFRVKENRWANHAAKLLMKLSLISFSLLWVKYYPLYAHHQSWAVGRLNQFFGS
jgi:hypothetical protein